VAAALHIEIRFLPVVTPELHAMDHLWRQVKGWGLAIGRPFRLTPRPMWCVNIFIELSPRERLRKAGVLSGHFWLAMEFVTEFFADYLRKLELIQRELWSIAPISSGS
jgi:hypothetical protein